MRKQTVDHVYEASFLFAVNAFESYQEELFFECLLNGSGIEDAKPVLT